MTDSMNKEPPLAQ